MLPALLQDVLINRKTPRQAALALSRSIQHEARSGNK
jgi:multiple sugar transport system substrate-binding protein/raffinose/stachyose/melibiose transport system substrate-binding protein